MLDLQDVQEACIGRQFPESQWGNVHPYKRVMKSACRARLSAPFTLADTRLEKAIMAAEGLSSKKQGSQPSVVAESLLVIEGISLSQHNFRGKIFCTSDSDVCLPGEQFWFFSPWAKASRWVTHLWTHLLANSGRLNHWLKKKNDMVNQCSCYKWIRGGPGSQCASCLKTLKSHCDLIQKSQFSYKLDLISIHTCTHTQKPGVGLLWLSFMNLDSYSLLYILTS